jgi:hypothetical protein
MHHLVSPGGEEPQLIDGRLDHPGTGPTAGRVTVIEPGGA